MVLMGNFRNDSIAKQGLDYCLNAQNPFSNVSAHPCSVIRQTRSMREPESLPVSRGSSPPVNCLALEEVHSPTV